MKSDMIFSPLCLLLCWMLPVGSEKISAVTVPEAHMDTQLSMAKDAVDDMYFGCNKTMAKMVKDNYFRKENTRVFADIWKKAKNCAKRNLKQREKGDEALTEDHMQAICAYTSDYKRFHQVFNAEVQTKRENYSTSFQFHSLHFWLTSAVQILNDNMKCRTAFRRTNYLFTGKEKYIIRFGFFASSSERNDLKQFGNKTCFKIKTCFGAFLKKYPHFGDKEKEVLIPPYEKFYIAQKIENKSVEGLTDCEVVYVLVSAGVQSNIDCQVAH